MTGIPSSKRRTRIFSQHLTKQKQMVRALNQIEPQWAHVEKRVSGLAIDEDCLKDLVFG